MRLKIVGELIKDIFKQYSKGNNQQNILDLFDLELQYGDNNRILGCLDFRFDRLLDKTGVKFLTIEEVEEAKEILGEQFSIIKTTNDIKRSFNEIRTAIYLERILTLTPDNCANMKQLFESNEIEALSLLRLLLGVCFCFALKTELDAPPKNKIFAQFSGIGLDKFNAIEQAIFFDLCKSPNAATITKTDIQNFIDKYPNYFTLQPYVNKSYEQIFFEELITANALMQENVANLQSNPKLDVFTEFYDKSSPHINNIQLYYNNIKLVLNTEEKNLYHTIIEYNDHTKLEINRLKEEKQHNNKRQRT